MGEPAPPDATWLRFLWIAVSALLALVNLLGGAFIYDLRAKLNSKVSASDFTALKEAFRAELAAERDAFRAALRTDREACETGRQHHEQQIIDHEARLRDLNTFRADSRAMAEKVGYLGSQVENLANVSDEHHKQNRADANEDRKATEARWTNVMAPLLKQLGEQTAAHTQAIDTLKQRDEDKETRLRDLEKGRPRRRT